MTKSTNPRLAMSIGVLLAAAALAGCAPKEAEKAETQKSSVADLALRNGAIYTVDGARSWAETIAIDDGRIVYVGNDAGAKDYIGPQTQVINLKGRMVLPGMQDVHIHPISGGIEANGCDLNAAEVPSRNTSQSIKKYADEHPNEPWIKGGGWSMASFGPGALARKELIDAVVPDRPVILWQPRRAHDLGEQPRRSKLPASRRTRRNRQTAASTATRRRASRRKPAGGRKRPRRRQDRHPTPTRCATTACATRSRC